MYTKHSTTTISEGADPLRPAWCHPTEGRSTRASPEYGWLFPVPGSPYPRFPPYVVRPLHVHGAPAYGGDSEPEVRMQSQAYRSKVRRASVRDLGLPNGPQPDLFRSPWAALADQAATSPSKMLNGTDLGGVDAHKSDQEVHRHRKCVRTGGAPNVTHSVVWWT